MQEVRTNSPNPVVQGCPDIPYTANERKVYITAVPTNSSLRYVFNLVMSGVRGSIGWDLTGAYLILYLKVMEEDRARFPDMVVGTEYWACFRMKENQ